MFNICKRFSGIISLSLKANPQRSEHVIPDPTEKTLHLCFIKPQETPNYVLQEVAISVSKMHEKV